MMILSSMVSICIFSFMTRRKENHKIKSMLFFASRIIMLIESAHLRQLSVTNLQKYFIMWTSASSTVFESRRVEDFVPLLCVLKAKLKATMVKNIKLRKGGPHRVYRHAVKQFTTTYSGRDHDGLEILYNNFGSTLPIAWGIGVCKQNHIIE